MIRLENINKYFFKKKKNQIHVINDTSLELPEKGLVTILGPSGSGKTTLLNVVGGLDTFDSGTLTIDNLKLNRSNYNKIESIRNTDIGYVFQDYKLLDDMSVFDNVALSLKMCGVKNKDDINKRVNEILNLLGIYRYRNRKAAMLSGGERQRVSIARAIVKNPRIVICDEPTGNLDSKKTVEIMNIIKAISKTRLVLLVSHESDIAKFYSDQIIEIKDGKIIANYQNETNGELNYEIANKIYLKDIKNHHSLKEKGIDLNIYSDADDPIKINLVIRNNNIYIETANANNTELVNDNSAFELLDEHYKGIDKSSIDSQSFDIEDIPNKKRTAIYSYWSMLKVGWNNLFKTNRMKKVTIACTALSAALVLYAVGVFLGVREDHKEDYLRSDESYLSIRVERNEKNYDLYKELKQRDDLYHVPMMYSIIDYSFPINAYYQALSAGSAYGQVILSSINLLDDSDIISGKLTNDPNDVVIDLSIYNGKYGLKDKARIAGILDYNDLIGEKIYLQGQEYTISGIVDKMNNSIYVNNEKIDEVVLNNFFVNFDIYDKNRTPIVSGNEPIGLDEAILPDVLMVKYPIGSKYQSSNKTFNVVGYFDSDDVNEFYTSKETVIAWQLSLVTEIVVAPKDKEAFMNEFKDKYDIKVIADEDYKVYDAKRKSSIASSTFSALIFIIITLVFIVLMMRASFLSRIKEVGILRAIGVGKADIIRMFSGETIILLTIGGSIGAVVMYYILSMLSQVDYFDFRISINPGVAICSIIALLVFYLVVVIIPVIFVLRKSPAEILSRKDI